jgi:hypothetical protein
VCSVQCDPTSTCICTGSQCVLGCGSMGIGRTCPNATKSCGGC